MCFPICILILSILMHFPNDTFAQSHPGIRWQSGLAKINRLTLFSFFWKSYKTVQKPLDLDNRYIKKIACSWVGKIENWSALLTPLRSDQSGKISGTKNIQNGLSGQDIVSCGVRSEFFPSIGNCRSGEIYLIRWKFC